jgi:outer membrane biosynthesis protein TonB
MALPRHFDSPYRQESFMNRTALLALAMVSALSLAACNKSPNPADTPSPSSSTTPPPVTTPPPPPASSMSAPPSTPSSTSPDTTPSSAMPAPSTDSSMNKDAAKDETKK